MSIVLAAGQHGPGDARQFVGNGYHGFVARSTLGQSVYPLPESPAVVLDAKQDGSGGRSHIWRYLFHNFYNFYNFAPGSGRDSGALAER